jgi:putative acetyltransferase
VITVQPATTAAHFEQAADLIGELVDWIRTTMGVDLGVEQPELRAELASLAERYDGTAAALFLASRDDAVVGTVAVRRHDDGSAELKRMFVRPAARGTGAADLLVDRAVAFASAGGCTELRLETARGAMDRAIAVYRRNGFVVADEQPELTIDGLVVMRRLLAAEACHV